MCVGVKSIHDPEGKLSALMAKDLGVTIDAKALRLFLLHRWDLVSCYSHAVHEQGKPADAGGARWLGAYSA